MVTLDRARVKQWFEWKNGQAASWQFLAAFAVWCDVVALHWHNDGLWYLGDAARHATNGLFWWDFLRSLPVDPLEYALSYYARYPVVNPTAYPPLFYLFEGLAYHVFGVAPFVAKGLVLVSLLAGSLYLIAWLRRWVGQEAGWIGVLLLVQPALVVLGHAVMLNVPSAMLGIAALYHWRRWLDDSTVTQLYLAVGFALVTVLTYIPASIVVLIMLSWAVVSGRFSALLQRRVLVLVGLSFAVLTPVALVQWTWAPTHRMVGFLLGDNPLWKFASWTYYLERLPQMTSLPLLILAGVGVILSLWDRRWADERRFMLTWLGICYAWFSIISVKEPRYALLMIPPIVCLAAVGLSGSVEVFRRTAEEGRRPLVSYTGLVLVVLHLWTVSMVSIPQVTGFKDIVAFMRASAPGERIFYDGAYGGVFSFYLRAGDEHFTQSVALGSKVLYAVKIDPKWGLVEYVSSPDEVMDRLRTECGCKWLVVERQVRDHISAAYHLRKALEREDFELVRSFRVEADGVRDVDVYKYRGVVQALSQIELRFPILGDTTRFRVEPVQP